MRKRWIVISTSICALILFGWLDVFSVTSDLHRLADFNIQRSYSPDGHYVAEFFQRMDSRLGDSSQSVNVLVWPADRYRLSSQEQFFVGHCWHRKESGIDTGPVPFGVRWTENRSLEISCPRFFGVYLKKERLFEVEAKYIGLFDDIWDSRWEKIPCSHAPVSAGCKP